MSEPVYLEYGECPKCGDHCQPECLDSEEDCDTEWVTCCNCRISWELYHEDPTDKRDETEPWRTYRIGAIESFDDMLVTPYQCDEKDD